MRAGNLASHLVCDSTNSKQVLLELDGRHRGQRAEMAVEGGYAHRGRRGEFLQATFDAGQVRAELERRWRRPS
jgi:hypothetical protein